MIYNLRTLGTARTLAGTSVEDHGFGLRLSCCMKSSTVSRSSQLAPETRPKYRYHVNKICLHIWFVTPYFMSHLNESSSVRKSFHVFFFNRINQRVSSLWSNLLLDLDSMLPVTLQLTNCVREEQLRSTTIKWYIHYHKYRALKK